MFRPGKINPTDTPSRRLDYIVDELPDTEKRDVFMQRLDESISKGIAY
jgi:hypothetical protein